MELKSDRYGTCLIYGDKLFDNLYREKPNYFKERKRYCKWKKQQDVKKQYCDAITFFMGLLYENGKKLTDINIENLPPWENPIHQEERRRRKESNLAFSKRRIKMLRKLKATHERKGKEA